MILFLWINPFESKETNPTVLKIHKRLRNESERYLEPETRHFSGIAFFRQVRDASIHRGFYQKAVIILSQLPFHNLFRHIIDLTAPEYFSKGEAALESMAAAVNRWPSPIAGETMELPFLGSVLRVRLPAYGEAQTVRWDILFVDFKNNLKSTALSSLISSSRQWLQAAEQLSFLKYPISISTALYTPPSITLVFYGNSLFLASHFWSSLRLLSSARKRCWVLPHW